MRLSGLADFLFFSFFFNFSKTYAFCHIIFFSFKSECQIIENSKCVFYRFNLFIENGRYDARSIHTKYYAVPYLTHPPNG